MDDARRRPPHDPEHAATPGPRRWTVDRLHVEVHADAHAAGAAMARAVAAELRRAAREREGEIAVAFASAPSQDAFLGALVALPEVPWTRVRAFHLDEYLGLPPTHPAAFSRYLDERLASRVPLLGFERLRGDAPDPEAEARRYAALLAASPLQVACLGIGENGHLAFNDPPVADLRDPHAVKRVSLDPTSRQQQVADGCFPELSAVPVEALTLTMPTLLAARAMFVVVPGPRKAAAVEATLRGPVGMRCPASALRGHPRATLYLDEASAARVDGS